MIAVAVLTAWSKRLLNKLLPDPERTLMWIKNNVRDMPKSDDRFRFVLCWLEDDHDGSNTKIVAQAFTGIDGVELVRSSFVVKANGAGADWRGNMQSSARKVLKSWEGDLAIVGLVKEPKKVLSLWFVPRAEDSEGTLRRTEQPFELKNATLQFNFHELLHSEIAAQALSAALSSADDHGERSQVVKNAQTSLADKITRLIATHHDTDDENPPGFKASLQVALGVTLSSLGDREGDIRDMEAAIEAFRAAIAEYAKRKDATKWTITQGHLGTSLMRLGLRKGDPRHFDEAISAFKSILTEYPREEAPMDWARTQYNLGLVRVCLGEQKGDTGLLEEARSAFEAALEENTRTRAPMFWAYIQSNLGSVLGSLGEQQSDPNRLEEAVVAFRAALEELTRERVPMDYGMTLMGFGTALGCLGQLNSDPKRLEEAIATFNVTLEVLTRERAPVHWAMAQNNLGDALSSFGEQKNNPKILQEATLAYMAALEERTRQQSPMAWASTQKGLGATLLRLGQQKGDVQHLEAAIVALEAAQVEYTIERAPTLRASTQKNLDLARSMLTEWPALDRNQTGADPLHPSSP